MKKHGRVLLALFAWLAPAWLGSFLGDPAATWPLVAFASGSVLSVAAWTGRFATGTLLAAAFTLLGSAALQGLYGPDLLVPGIGLFLWVASGILIADRRGLGLRTLALLATLVGSALFTSVLPPGRGMDGSVALLLVCHGALLVSVFPFSSHSLRPQLVLLSSLGWVYLIWTRWIVGNYAGESLTGPLALVQPEWSYPVSCLVAVISLAGVGLSWFRRHSRVAVWTRVGMLLAVFVIFPVSVFFLPAYALSLGKPARRLAWAPRD